MAKKEKMSGKKQKWLVLYQRG